MNDFNNKNSFNTPHQAGWGSGNTGYNNQSDFSNGNTGYSNHTGFANSSDCNGYSSNSSADTERFNTSSYKNYPQPEWV
ncbi:MAG: hypothetical protein UE295_01445, partial [Acutalibacteraceae bacterium]|nr:hypothetical protein [Acutalibacteraceae bacterium]